MINGWNRPGEKPPKDGEMCVIIFRHDGTPENMDAMGLAIYNDGKGWNITEDVHGKDTHIGSYRERSNHEQHIGGPERAPIRTAGAGNL